MIKRETFLEKVRQEFKVHSSCALLGPRQCGKTTLAKMYAETQPEFHYFDCENDLHLTRLENPLYALKDLKGLIVIDEIQLRPQLFSPLRVIIDEDPHKKFLITGSASRDLIHQSSQTLAGRIGYNQVTPFSINEVEDWERVWKRGGYPKSYLSIDESNSIRWRDEYIKTFLERDLAMLGVQVNISISKKLWRMLAHYNGQTINYAAISSSLDIDQRTLKRYLSVLEGAFMITLLKPWHQNLSKREVKSTKVYIRDTGLLHRLLNIYDDDIHNTPYAGASFEGLVIENLQRMLSAFEDSYFWGTHGGAEIDFLANVHGKKIGFEVKLTDRPRVTKSIRSAISDLSLEHVYIVTPHQGVHKIEERISCMGIQDIWKNFDLPTV